MSFISGFTELFTGKKTEVQPIAPQVSIEEKKQDASNLEAMMSRGADFRNPADAKRLEELRAQIAQAETTQAPQPQVETQPAQPTTMSEVQKAQPIQEPEAA